MTIRPRAFARVLLALCACAVPALAQTPPASPPGLEDLAGRWTNASAAITAIEIKVEGSKATLHVWAKCQDSDCDWGEVQAETNLARDSDTCCAPALSAAFAGDGVMSTVSVSLGRSEDLRVVLITSFRDPGRSLVAHGALFREDSPAVRSPFSVEPLPLEVGGRFKEPRKVKQVNPHYPANARRDGIQGVVVVRCTIDRDGKVTDTEVLQGPRELIDAAVTAVKQWRYTPTTIDGVAVPVMMTVTVNFRLGQRPGRGRS